MTLQAIEQATLPHSNFEGYLHGSEVSVGITGRDLVYPVLTDEPLYDPSELLVGMMQATC